VWFAQTETQFFLAGVSSETAKFFHIISQLDHRYAAEVEDIISSLVERTRTQNYGTSSYSGCPPRESKASASYSRSRRWATASRPSS
jgi:hypothetical protein